MTRAMTARVLGFLMVLRMPTDKISNALTQVVNGSVVPPGMLCKSHGGQDDLVQSLVADAGLLKRQNVPVDASNDAFCFLGTD